MKVKYYEKIFRWGISICAIYLAFSIIPPTVKLGIYIGTALVIWNSLLWLYARHLIKKGKGEETRP